MSTLNTFDGMPKLLSNLEKLPFSQKTQGDSQNDSTADRQAEQILFLKKNKITQVVDAFTFIPRLLFAVARTPHILLTFGIGSIFYRYSCLDPDVIIKNKTPILLIHGSCSNQRQWDIQRVFLESKKTGHVFSLNLNKKRFNNDEMSISEYAKNRVVKKIQQVKEQYSQQGLQLNKIVIVGHSMGGLVGADYAINCAGDTGVQVSALIAISVPWKGTGATGRLDEINKKPEGAFIPKNPVIINLTNKLLNKERAGRIHIYTFSSRFDPIVSPHSSTLPIPSKNQMLSSFHDHYSSMFAPLLAQKIRDEWIVPNIEKLPSCS